jgi:hypothetical protein
MILITEVKNISTQFSKGLFVCDQLPHDKTQRVYIGRAIRSIIFQYLRTRPSILNHHEQQIKTMLLYPLTTFKKKKKKTHK